MGAKKVVAGEQISDAMRSVKDLNDKGLVCTVDHLGEFVDSKEAHCLDTLKEIHISGVDLNMSLKLTSLGLDIDEEFCLENMREIVGKARMYNNFVRIDMEEYVRNQKTIDIYRKLVEEFPGHVGLVLQASLYKTGKDVEILDEVSANLRLCKGAYKESQEVSFSEKFDVDKNFLNNIKKHMINGNYAAVATHDEKSIEEIKGFVEREEIVRDKFEFQMLYGIRKELQEKLVEEGFKVRVYIPYDEDWWGYFMRRLAERPDNVGFVVKSMFKR
ncbi:proline dehydrogenase [Alteribacter lacisalsi]|uniref:proline dehydrogenase n=1 Tax=Alteribacter lacisalsi TaxID=2045244 RepID=A0A2W0H957_9BACI|nr:proline dehydrogenase family protein [Alteribacter lacisalsi]PYZ96610.1 proline dehydrogenase [Alteribacter lacisalsi]